MSDSVSCLECGRDLIPSDDPVNTPDGSFCRPCYEDLTERIQAAVQAQSRRINWAGALAGGIAGGAIGVLVWWGFTVVTNISFGLVAVVIGFLVGRGVVMGGGNKRARPLQAASVSIAGAAFFYATYLVNRTYILRYYREEEGVLAGMPWIPGMGLFSQVISLDWGLFDFLFLAFVLWEAWRFPGPATFGRRG